RLGGRARAAPDPRRHLLRVRPAAHAPARLAHPVLQPARGGRRRPHPGLPHAPARPEAPGGARAPRPQLPRGRRRRLLQRHGDAGRGRRRHPVPPARQRGARVPAVPGDPGLRRAARRGRGRAGGAAVTGPSALRDEAGRAWERYGFFLRPGVFSPAELEELRAAAERVAGKAARIAAAEGRPYTVDGNRYADAGDITVQYEHGTEAPILRVVE